MPTNSYDLIVIGDDFAGLVAGTLCSRRGMRVLVLSHGGGRHDYQLGPHRLPIEPIALCGMSSPAVKRVLDELHLGHALKRRLQAQQASFQFVAPDLRLDIAADAHVLRHELTREVADPANTLRLCEQASAVAQHFDSVLAADDVFPPTGFWKRREVGRNAMQITAEADEWMSEVESDDVLRAVTELPALLGTHIDAGSLSAAARARSFHLWRLGAPRIRGDWEALREIFREKLSQGNGETRSARAMELTFRWGRVNGVVLENGEELGANHVIVAAPLSELESLVKRKVPKRLTQCAEGLTVSGYRYTLNLVVDEAGIPEGMSSPVLIHAGDNNDHGGDGAVAIYLDAPDDEARVAVTVSAVSPVPDDGRKLDDVLADLRVRLRERIEMVMPFFSDHVLLAHSPHESALPEGQEFEPGSDFPVPPTPIWSSTLESALGVSAVPYSVGLKHLTVASNQVMPHLGVEGAFATGWYAAKLACEATGKKRDYLKDEIISG